MPSTADMAELVDALVSGTSGSNALEVRVFLSAPCFGVVAQLIERYVRIVEVVGLSPISSTKIRGARPRFFMAYQIMNKPAGWRFCITCYSNTIRRFL